MYVMKLSTIPKKAIWGGVKLRDYFNYDYPEGIGQSWSFSAQKDDSSVVVNGNYKGKNLLELWEDHQELFKSELNRFPFIIGLVGPEDSLSIQVHPDAEYAKKLGLPSGKNEAWYFIEADESADLIYGSHAKNVDELKSYIEKQDWENLIKRISVKKDDFVYVPAGMLHAMQKGVIAYEVQEATDITYRLYDFDRKDKDGHKRPLDIQESIDSMKYDFDEQNHSYKVFSGEGYKETIYIDNESFCIKKIEINEEANYNFNKYQLLTVIRGNCTIDGIPFRAGESALLPKGLNNVHVEGQVEFMITQEGTRL